MIKNWLYLKKDAPGLKKETIESPSEAYVNVIDVNSPNSGNIMSVSDFSKVVNTLNFKDGSIGPKVSFRKESGTDPYANRDIIIPEKLEITRDNGGGIYNIALEEEFNANVSPMNTTWNTQYLDPTNTNWAPLWDVSNRTYNKWRRAIKTPDGNYSPPQYVGMPTVMKYDDGNGTVKYYLFVFTEWGVGAYGEYGFAYDRYEIFESLNFSRPDDEDSIVDIISPGVHIARDSNGGQIFNAVNEPEAQIGVSPRNTKWNSIYTDARAGYSGFGDLNNLESRVYTDFTSALDGSVGNNVLDTELIMWDMTTDLYYKVTFSEWTQGGNGGGFTYTRTVIPQSCGIKFADQTVMNTAPALPILPTYKVYTALLTQNGGDNFLNLTGGELTIGVTYFIQLLEGADFSNVGGSNVEGTYFIATGTTPNSWGDGGQLEYNTGAPVVTVLENTIGDVFFNYDDLGSYIIIGDFPLNKTTFVISNIGLVLSDDISIRAYIDTDNIYITTTSIPFSGTSAYADGILNNTPIEIRVYN